MYNKSIFLASVFSIALFTSCDPDEPVAPVEEEVITTLNYTLTPMGGGTAVTLGFQDVDGEGGNAPTITGGTLAADQTYTGALELLNESTSPSENITVEIREEDNEHQFFFNSSVPNLSIAYNDKDGNDNPLGLATIVTTGAAATGDLAITLRHQPDKTASGVAAGSISNAGGETDIQVTFPISVQ